MHLFNQTAYVYKKDHAHSIHNPHVKMYFHSHPDGMPADGYQHVSALVSCKHSHLHKSGSFFQFLLQLKVFQDNKAANEKDCLQDPLVKGYPALGHYTDRAARRPGTSPWAS